MPGSIRRIEAGAEGLANEDKWLVTRSARPIAGGLCNDSLARHRSERPHVHL